LESQAYALSKAKLEKSKFRVTHKDLEEEAAFDSYIRDGMSDTGLTSQEVRRLLSDAPQSGDTRATSDFLEGLTPSGDILEGIWSIPDANYNDRLRELDTLRAANHASMKKEREKYFSTTKTSD
jgi:hypothetical protein